MEVWSDLVNLNLFANSIRKHAPPPTPVCTCLLSSGIHVLSVDFLSLLAREPPLVDFSVCARAGTQRGEMISVTVDAAK